MAWTEAGLWKGTRNPELDLLLPGLDRGMGRDKDRFRCSAGTKDFKTFDRRRRLVKDLASRLVFEPLRAVVDEHCDIAALERAYREGAEALIALGQTAKQQRLPQLTGLYLAELPGGTYRDSSEQNLDRFLEFLGPTASTADVTARSINSFLLGLTALSRGKVRPQAAGTRNRYRAVLQGFCSWLVREGHLPTSPFFLRGAVKVFDESGSGKRLPELEPDEVAAYLEKVEDLSNPAYKLLLWGHIETGADAGELMTALTVRYCRFPSVPGALTRLQFIRTKTEGRGAVERFVPVTPAFSQALQAHIVAYQLDRDDQVFGMCEYFRAYKIHTAAISPKEITRKDLRHVAAIRWRRAGADLEHIREWLGHATIEQTRVYAAFKPDDSFNAPMIEKIQAEYHPSPTLRLEA